jgi:hypothetical protein
LLGLFVNGLLLSRRRQRLPLFAEDAEAAAWRVRAGVGVALRVQHKTPKRWLV